MSSEEVKKRGRPKKVVSPSNVSEKSEPATKTTVRKKSTKASSATSTVAANELAENSSINSKKGRAAKAVALNVKPANTTSLPKSTAGARPAVTNPTTEVAPPNVTPTDSKILNQVHALSSKTVSIPKSTGPKSKSKPPLSEPLTPPSTQPNIISKSTSNAAQAASTPAATSPPVAQKLPTHTNAPVPKSSIPAPKPHISPTAPSAPQPKSVPIAALNSAIVSQISSSTGARPGRKSWSKLPPNYNSAARRVTMTIVALPIAIVTSWVLYDRLVLGNEKKLLVHPSMVALDRSSPMAEELRDNISKTA